MDDPKLNLLLSRPEELSALTAALSASGTVNVPIGLRPAAVLLYAYLHCLDEELHPPGEYASKRDKAHHRALARLRARIGAGKVGADHPKVIEACAAQLEMQWLVHIGGDVERFLEDGWRSPDDWDALLSSGDDASPATLPVGRPDLDDEIPF